MNDNLERYLKHELVTKTFELKVIVKMILGEDHPGVKLLNERIENIQEDCLKVGGISD